MVISGMGVMRCGSSDSGTTMIVLRTMRWAAEMQECVFHGRVLQRNKHAAAVLIRYTAAADFFDW